MLLCVILLSHFESFLALWRGWPSCHTLVLWNGESHNIEMIQTFIEKLRWALVVVVWGCVVWFPQSRIWPPWYHLILRDCSIHPHDQLQCAYYRLVSILYYAALLLHQSNVHFPYHTDSKMVIVRFQSYKYFCQKTLEAVYLSNHPKCINNYYSPPNPYDSI